MSKLTGICSGCGFNKNLVKAHIIPESFFRQLRTGDRAPELRTDQSGVFPKRTPRGIYDRNILCCECEALFQDIDDYAARILIYGESKFHPIVHDGIEIGHVLEGYDYDLLKLFFIGVLWRAHVSTMEFYVKVALGPYADAALSRIRRRDPGPPQEFSIVVARFKNHYASKGILDPHPERWWGIKAYRFYMGGYVVHMKTDKRHFPRPIDQAIMDPDRPLLIPARDIGSSAEFEVMKKAATNW